MANNNINVLQTVIQLRRGTEEQWELVKDSFIPREGEPCTTIYDDGRDALVKIGDGKHTWGQLGYTRDSFLVTATSSSEGGVTTDKSLEEILKAVEQNKYVYAKVLGFEEMAGTKYLFLPYLGMAEDGDQKILFFGNDLGRLYLIQGGGHFTPVVYMEAKDGRSMPFNAQDKSIVNLADSNELSSAVTKQYTDNSTPTFIFLEEQDGAIKSKTTDLETLKIALMSQTNGYTQTSNPLYKAIKCYAMLDGNCYDLVYSSKESPQEAGKVAIVKRTFYAITTDGLNKLNVVIDENQTDENQKVVWTKEAQGVASEQFIVTMQNVDGVNKSDKTPAEIAAAVQAGKQVILRIINDDNSIDTGLLISVSNDAAIFHFGSIDTDVPSGAPPLPVINQMWFYILSDKTAKESIQITVPYFMITTDDSGKYVSQLSPDLLFQAAIYGSGVNILLMKDNETFISTIYIDAEDGLHIYFPDYAKNKIYDLKWNEDDNPCTYTFTELGTVTKEYVDNSTPTFIYLKEQNGVIKSLTTDLDMLSNVLINQTYGYALERNPLYKAIKCYAVLDGNCYDLVYSYLNDTEEVGKKSIIGRTFYANTSNGLNKLNVVIDENQTDENQKVVWTKEAQGVASEQFIVTIQNVDGVSKSDKTPAEIKAAVEAGKWVILKDNSEDVVQFRYLINAGNNIATFCGSKQLTEKMTDLDPIIMRNWCSILNDKTVIINSDINLGLFEIIKDSDGTYKSALSPMIFLSAYLTGNVINVVFEDNGKAVSGVFNLGSNQEPHFYFPDYAKNKVYDLKWNGDENPSTYTFTESVLDEKPMVVTFTVTDQSTFVLKADTPYADIVEAANKGRIVYAFVPKPVGPLFGQLTNVNRAGLAFNAFSGDGSAVIHIQMESDSNIHGTAITTLYRQDDIVGGGDFYAGNHKITSVKEPTNPSDAATKGYADNILTAGNSDSVVIKSSTSNSTKKFRITVDDAGTISATEVVS